MPITKEFKTIEKQIELLDSRHLKFRNKSKAKVILSKYNYFDIINGFESIFVINGRPTKEYEGVYFEDFCDCYNFDRKLKTATLIKILDIEARLKTSIAYHFAEAYCNTIPNTMNYTLSSFYQAPITTDTHLTNVFNTFELFRQTTYNPDGTIRRRSHISDLKNQKQYIAVYDKPPFWVTIKTLSFGALYYLFVFLPNNVKERVLADFGFKLSDAICFTQAVSILKEIRNQCAHLELITRFKLKQDPKLNNYYDIKAKAKLSRRDLYFIDVVKILKLFGEIKTIKNTIRVFYYKSLFKFRKKIAIKILSKMGRKKLSVWMQL